MTAITVSLDDRQLARFKGPAELLGVPPEEMARVAIESFLARPGEDFETIIDEVLAEHGDLLRRLAR
jgi:hypothetical protein